MLNKEKHRQIMYNILIDIFTSDLSKNLAFKWWTVCYFLHELDRFSTDLDFDFIWEYKNIDDEIIFILKKYWDIKKTGRNLTLSYWKRDINIKANKLVALTERNTNRDIYDVYFFFKNNFDINEELIIERTGNNKKMLFTTILKKISTLPDNYKILDWLWDVLDDNKHKNFIKVELINKLIWLLEFNIKF